MLNKTFQPSNRYWAETHQVENLPEALENYNVFTTDKALTEFVKQFEGAWGEQNLIEFGAKCGSQEVIEWGFQANASKPELFTHDRYGKRVDEVRFHPAYHDLMQLAMSEGLHSDHWLDPKAGAHVVRAAKYYLLAQMEAGHGCPITMTSAAIPTLRRQSDLFHTWAPKIMAKHYDPRNISHLEKDSVTIGMAMTEKQGGSDVRQNSTRAYPLGQSGSGQLYELVGHKYFVSAPMCDAFLVLAQTEPGVSCFLVPRWRPDGSKNPLQVQRLKNKMGNVSNASSETELRGALGWLVGEEGRGVSAILEMVAMTRFDCMVGSSALMRQAVAQITHHCRSRVAFGKKLSEQPLMQNVLADLILEQEAALAFTMRLAKALDASEHSEDEKNLVRMGTAVGKYWICKRVPGHVYEAMECIGGSGVMEDSIMPRLFRESPINTIWEGSGNVQCLDVLRALQKSPASLDAFMNEIHAAQGKHSLLDSALDRVQASFTNQSDVEYRSRQIVGDMALVMQAASLWSYGDASVAEAFCEARLSGSNDGWVYGTLPRSVDCDMLIRRAMP